MGDDAVLPQLADVADDAVRLAREWQRRAAQSQTRMEARTSGRLARLVADAEGLAFAVRFIDEVARPEDPIAAAAALSRLEIPATTFLPAWDKLLLRLGKALATSLPLIVVPLARRRLRHLVGHLILDDHDPSLRLALSHHRASGFHPNVNLLGEMVLGEAEGISRAQRIDKLLLRNDIDHVSVKLSALIPQISVWDTAGTVEMSLERLRPLFRTALGKGQLGRYAGASKFINLDMEEYKDLELTLQTFEQLLAEPEFAELEAGIVLQAYLPDSVAALERLVTLARSREEKGWAGFKIRLVKGANLAMEATEAELHGWEQAPFGSKEEVDANYLRLIERALRADVPDILRIGVASHNLYDVAAAHLLAEARGATARLDVEMLQGMAPAQARVVRQFVHRLVLYTPVVDRSDFDVAVSYLVRRLEENAQPQNYLHAMFRDAAAMSEQERRFRASVAASVIDGVSPRRSADRAPIGEVFANTPDSDPALASTRDWARDAVARQPGPGLEPLTTKSQVDDAVATAVAAATAWAATPAPERARLLRQAARSLEAMRADLVGAMAHEGGKPVSQADPEVSEAVDFARYYADAAEQLESLSDGARFTPPRVTLVTPPWNFPVAIPVGGVLAALAAGSAVIIKPAPQTPRCAELAMQALWEAGIPREVTQVVHCDEDDLGAHLVAHADVDLVILTGAAETARLFEGWRSGRDGGPRVQAETSGKNSLIITPSADLDLAVADLVASAFGHAGQKCSAASLGILVGSVASSKRFRRQLIDAVASLKVGWPDQLGARVGPLIAQPTEKLMRALTTLEQGERWLVRPRPLDSTGRLWHPGLRSGVQPGSFFHLTEVFGPVLGLMHARDLDQAIEFANGTRFGLTGGIHSLDPDEIEHWLTRIEVGNAYINRGTTGAIVRRQPFGGWKDSSVGPGTKAGGPNYVTGLGTWSDDTLPSLRSTPTAKVHALMVHLEPLVTDASEQEWLEAAVESDAAALAGDLAPSDLSGLEHESNILRYCAVPLLVVNCGPGTRPVELARVLLAASAAGTRVVIRDEVGISAELPELRDRLSAEPLASFLPSLPPGSRIRALGDPAIIRDAIANAALESLPFLDASNVLANGRLELLKVTREQSVSRTLHRHGHVMHASSTEE